MPLPQVDRDHLDSKSYAWKATDIDGFTHLTISDFPMPSPYDPRRVTLLIRLPAGYPMANPDLFFVAPHVKLNGSDPQACGGRLNALGIEWQQWSRHNQHWRPGVDSLRSFIAAIRRELQRGL